MPRLAGVPALFLAASLSACCCGVTTPDDPAAGTVRFDASGDVTGGFGARGAYPGPAEAGTRSWSFAADYASVFQSPVPLYGLSASAHTGGSRSNVFSLSLEDPRAGQTYTCDAPAVASGACAFLGALGLGNDWSTNADPPLEREYEVVSGSVTVREVGTRLRGTFTLQVEEVDSGAGASLTGGTFDVPILPVDDVLAARTPVLAPRWR